MPLSEEEKKQRKLERNRVYKKRTGYKDSIKWNAAHVKKYSLRINRDSDGDMVEWMESIPNKGEYLRALVRADMEKHK